MTIRDTVIKKIEDEMPFPGPIDSRVNLYTDLGFDSLSFISLLMELEEILSITFDIAEMETCLRVDLLVEAAEKKVKEREGQ